MVTIGIDLDGTLSESIENILTPSQLEKFRTIYNKFRAKEPNKLQGKVMLFTISKIFNYKWKHWKNVNLLSDDIPEIVSELSKMAKILIITSTFGKKEYIESWLKNNGVVYDDVIFSPPSEKWKYCDIIIDDRIVVVKEAVKHGKIGILLYGGKNKDNENMIVAKNWKEIAGIIKKLLN